MGSSKEFAIGPAGESPALLVLGHGRQRIGVDRSGSLAPPSCVRNERLDPMRASHAASGYVHVEGARTAEVVERMQAVLDHFTLVTVDA